MSTMPIIPVFQSDGVNVYQNNDGTLVPMKECICGLAYHRHCPVEEHRRRATWEPYAALKLAGHVKSRAEWLEELKSATKAIE